MFLGAAGAAAGGATAAAVGAGELHKTLTFSSLRYLFHNFFFFKSHHFFCQSIFLNRANGYGVHDDCSPASKRLTTRFELFMS